MSAQLVILGLLSEQPCHGYELRQEVERRLYATYINLSGGSLYYNLGQLERSGYVEKAWAEQKGRYPTRQIYQITQTGREYLLTELRRLFFDTESREKVFDPLNAALAFGHLISTAELSEALEAHLRWAQKRLAWVIDQQAYWGGQKTKQPQAKIIEHGLAQLKAEIDWLKQFLNDLDGHERNGVKPISEKSISSSTEEDDSVEQQ